ncbi:MAG: magnesium transporter [Nitrospira sp.]|nr:magnesium transporter [Nitrospira sp.]MBH0183481.1 magnesium transporter [Nitrospira sp.]MBH0187200.1 magnesium transporter [Nitrospira sp.]MBH0189778.1 magnesium transporter [Nitrospira sp.]
MATAADLMTVDIPRSDRHSTVGDMIGALRGHTWDEVGHIYLVDDQAALVGQVPIERLLQAKEQTYLTELEGSPPIEVFPGDEAETVALRAVERHDADVAVIDNRRRLLGAIPIGRLLALLHEEHVDNFLRMGGVSRMDHLHLSLTVQQILTAVRARLPWLMVGLGGGFLAGGVASAFEASLKREVALAFFLPLVVYMADAVGTQTETVLVRRLAYGEVSLWEQLARESVIGASIGVIIAVVASGGLWLWSGHPALAIVVGTSLGMTAIIATIMASLLPMGLARLGADPALASGPVATVVQDILSVGIYLMIATAVLPM